MGDPGTGPERPKIQEPCGRMAPAPPAHPIPARPPEPRGPFLRGAGWWGVVYRVVWQGTPPWVCPGGIPRGVYHAIPPGTPPPPPRDAQNGPLGSGGLAGRAPYGNTREYTGTQGIHGNTVYTGNTREYREYREYTEYREHREYTEQPGIHGIPGIPGITGNTRNTREHTGTRPYGPYYTKVRPYGPYYTKVRPYGPYYRYSRYSGYSRYSRYSRVFRQKQ